jgi:ubiquinone/menaquinone biosynthesis C-methylase UbiE
MAEAQANQEQIRYWNEESGPRWVKQQQKLDAQIDQLGLAAMQRADVKLGEHVLDVGCGCGQTSLELAERVGPNGSVVGIDISQPMLARARERQHELGIKNLEFLRADAQTYSFERERFDLIFSRFGIMFFDDPPAAFANLRAALRPDGRLCFICWQALEKNDWVRVPLMATAQHVQLPAPPAPGAPGPFAFADPDRVRHILGAGGFAEVSFETLEAQLSLGGATSVDEAVEFMLEIGVIAMLLRDADTQVRARAAQAIREALTPYASRGGVRLGGTAWIVFARPAC